MTSKPPKSSCSNKDGACKDLRDNCTECNVTFCFECDKFAACTTCGKPYCISHLNKLSCTCRATPFSIHPMCYADSLVCLSCLESFVGNPSVMISMKAVDKLIKLKDDEILEQMLKYVTLQCEHESLKIKYRVHMDVYHPANEDSNVSKKRKIE